MTFFDSVWIFSSFLLVLYFTIEITYDKYTDDGVGETLNEVLNGLDARKNFFQISDVVEKPSIKAAPSNLAVIGRYILTKKIFHTLQKQKRGRNNEIHITDAIKDLILKKNKFIGHVFAGKYLDCGTMNGYINSSLKISKLKLWKFAW